MIVNITFITGKAGTGEGGFYLWTLGLLILNHESERLGTQVSRCGVGPDPLGLPLRLQALKTTGSPHLAGSNFQE